MKNNSAKISTLRKISMVAFFLLFVFGNSSYGFRFRIEEIEVGNNGIRVKATFHKKKHRPSPDTTNYDAVAYVFDYHKRNGVQQLVGLNDVQKSQVLQRASDLVTTGKHSPDTTAITQAWEEVIGRGWNYDAVAYVFDYHKRNGVQQLVGLNDMQKSQVLKRASDLVTTGKCSPDTTSITQAWEEIIGRRWNEL